METEWKGRFATLWVGQAVSILTSSVSQYALLWYITAQTGSAALLSVAALVGLLPQGILSLFTGAVADRYDRRTIMAVADGAIGLVSLVLVGVSHYLGHLPIGAILVTLALRSVGSAFHSPCLQAVTPLIVPKEMLARCAGWSQGVQTVSLLVSPALAALLFVAVPMTWIIALDTLGAVVAIGFLLLARLPRLEGEVEGEEQFHLIQECRAGYAMLRQESWLCQLCGLCGLLSLAVVPVATLFPLVSMTYFGGTAAWAALVQTGYSLGMLCGSVLLGLWGGFSNKMTTITATVFLLGGCLLGMSRLGPGEFTAFVLLAVGMGLAAPFFNTLMVALVQERVPQGYLGRVLGLTNAIVALATPVGLAASAAFADQIGLIHWFGLAGLVAVGCGILCLVLPGVRDCDRAISQQ